MCILGTVQHGLTMAEAGSNYILLAIGDGLVAQVPALMLSIAAAVIVTRVSSPLDLTGQMSSQFGSAAAWRSEAHTSELQSLLRISYAVFCFTQKKQHLHTN